MKKFIFISLLVILGYSKGMTQEPIYIIYPSNSLLINPVMNYSHLLNINVDNTTEFYGRGNFLSSSNFSVNASARVIQFGLQYQHTQKENYYTNQKATLFIGSEYAFISNIKIGTALSLGMQKSLFRNTLMYDRYNSYPDNKQLVMDKLSIFDLGSGIRIRHYHFMAGISANYLNTPKLPDPKKNKHPVKYSAYIRYSHRLPNRGGLLNLGAIYQNQDAFYENDLDELIFNAYKYMGVNADYANYNFLLGMAYRYLFTQQSNMYSFNIGYKPVGNLDLKYSFSIIPVATNYADQIFIHQLSINLKWSEFFRTGGVLI
jgi:hypothetical protein